MTTEQKPSSIRAKPLRHGLHSLRSALVAIGDDAGWLESLGEVGAALRSWRVDLISDLGGEEAVSAQQRVVVDLAAKTYLLLESVDRFLLEQPSLVNRRERRLYQVVLQRQQIADSLAKYMGQLGLERRVRPVPSLGEYLAKRGRGRAQQGGEDS